MSVELFRSDQRENIGADLMVFYDVDGAPGVHVMIGVLNDGVYFCEACDTPEPLRTLGIDMTDEIADAMEFAVAKWRARSVDDVEPEPRS